MEQLRTFLEAVKKHHFWILCGLACVVAFVMMMVSSNKLLSAYEQKKSTISGIDQRVGGLINGELPNDKWVEATRKKTEEFRQDVYAAWTKLYSQQKKAVYVWPPELGAEFVKAFSNDAPKATIDRDKIDEFSQYYQNFVTTTLLPGLAKTVDAEWVGGAENAANQGVAPGPGRHPPRAGAPQVQHNPGAAGAEDHAVVWDPDDQQRLFNAYTWEEPPSEMQIRYAQEEMWVMKAMFDAIHRANGPVKNPGDAIVRVIQEASVGIDADTATPLGEGTGRIVHLRPALPANPQVGGAPALDASAPTAPAFDPRQARRGRGRDPSAPGPRGGRSRGGAPSPYNGPVGSSGFQGVDGQTASADPNEKLKNFRYVDPKGKPLAAAELANVANFEYRLMAFKLVVACDEARFPVLVSELANSPLPLEVREVRVNVEKEDAAARGGPVRRDRRGPQASPAAQGDVLHNATIEIWGMAYLINRPDPAKLHMPDTTTPADAKAAADGAASKADQAKPAGAGTATDGAPPGATRDNVGGAATSTTGAAKPATAADAVTRAAAPTTTPAPDQNGASDKSTTATEKTGPADKTAPPADKSTAPADQQPPK